VSFTPVNSREKHKVANISCEFLKKIVMDPMGYSAAQGNWTGKGLKKGRGRFPNFSEAPTILYKNITSLRQMRNLCQKLAPIRLFLQP
jgi:hypothetical protein